MARKKNAQKPKASCPAWLATYGDLVTLVLTFFVLLFSFSTIDAKKWEAVATALSGQPGVFEGYIAPAKPTDVTIAPSIPEPAAEDLVESSDEWDEIESMISDLINTNHLQNEASVAYTTTEIRIDLSGDILFDSGQDALKPDSVTILVDVINTLRKDYLPMIGFFRIEGHTDNVQINTEQFPSNWYLSTARANAVLKHLFAVFPPETNPDLPYSMYEASGLSEYHPKATNDTPEGRAQNRRVEFVIVRAPDARDIVPILDIATDAAPASSSQLAY